MHVRTQVRNAAVTRLAGLSYTGARVFASRVRPVDSTQMPCLLVYTDEEELGPATIHGTYARAFILNIKAVAEQSCEGIDTLLDNIAEEVEAELGSATPLLVSAAQKLTLTAITVEFDDEGEKPAGRLTLAYSIRILHHNRRARYGALTPQEQRNGRFGNVLSDTSPGLTVPFGFAGGLHDRHTGLVRFGYRDYDPEVGRWTAKDPIGIAGGDTDVFAYCFSDPIGFVDRSGLASLYWAFGGAAGFSLNPSPNDGDKLTYYAGSVSRFAGSTITNGSEEGVLFSIGAGYVFGVAFAGGPQIGLNFNPVEGLEGRSSAVGLLAGIISFELSFDDNNSWTGFSFGWGRGIGLGGYAIELGRLPVPGLWHHRPRGRGADHPRLRGHRAASPGLPRLRLPRRRVDRGGHHRPRGRGPGEILAVSRLALRQSKRREQGRLPP